MKLYTSVEVTVAPVRVPIQRSLVPSFTSVLGWARTFHLALILCNLKIYNLAFVRYKVIIRTNEINMKTCIH